MFRLDAEKLRKTVRGEMTQQELGEKIGLPQNEVSRILRAGERMKVSHFLTICGALEMYPGNFLVETKDETLLINNSELVGGNSDVGHVERNALDA